MIPDAISQQCKIGDCIWMLTQIENVQHHDAQTDSETDTEFEHKGQNKFRNFF